MVQSVIITFGFDEPVKARADRLRGFFATRYGEYTLIHHHLKNNRLLYRSPVIQYKVIQKTPL
ncbi:MAG: CRISPR-associated endonuclease Cas6, partial [candidate division WOR-3 bacterium]